MPPPLPLPLPLRFSPLGCFSAATIFFLLLVAQIIHGLPLPEPWLFHSVLYTFCGLHLSDAAAGLDLELRVVAYGPLLLFTALAPFPRLNRALVVAGLLLVVLLPSLTDPERAGEISRFPGNVYEFCFPSEPPRDYRKEQHEQHLLFLQQRYEERQRLYQEQLRKVKLEHAEYLRQQNLHQQYLAEQALRTPYSRTVVHVPHVPTHYHDSCDNYTRAEGAKPPKSHLAEGVFPPPASLFMHHRAKYCGVGGS